MIELKKRKYNEPTSPTLPYKRELNYREYDILRKNFGSKLSPGGWHSWSQIDANGHIILSADNKEQGLFYITEDDLSTDLDWRLSEKFQSYYKVHKDTILQKPMNKDGSLSKEEDEDEIIPESFTVKEEIEFIKEIKKIFNIDKVKYLHPICKFKVVEIYSM